MARRLRPLGLVLGRIARTLLPVAIGTLLLAAGVFFAWQAWLVRDAENGAAEADEVRAQAIQAISAVIADTQNRVREALASAAVTDPLSGGVEGRESAATAFRAAVPDASTVAFFSPGLDEVLAGDLAAFGYARAQMLMQAQAHSASAPVQMRVEKDAGRRLIVAMPVMHEKTTVAFAMVSMPFEPVLDAFRRSHISGAQLDLRQGEGHGDLLIATIGSGSGTSVGDLGEPIAGSMLRIGKGEPEYFIVGPHDFTVLVVLAVVCLVLGFVAFWLRLVGVERALQTLTFKPKPEAAELTLTEALKQTPIAAAGAKTPAIAAGEAPNRSSRTKKDAVDTAISLDRSIFRAYDIRGVVGETLTPAVARALGRAIGSEARDRNLHEIVVGRDGRLSGPELVASLIEGLRSTGMDVIDIGAVPTPVVYFGCYHLNTGSGISVTGSHNPPDYNGFKIVLGGETLSEGAIQALYARIAESRFVDGSGGLQVMDISGDYVERNYEAAAADGRIVQIATLGGAKFTANIARLMVKRLHHTGSTLRPRSNADKAAMVAAIEAKVMPLLREGRIKPLMDSTFPLEKAADAHRRMETGEHIGKIVLAL